jgi:alkyl hydroperoxide reductase subunit AhpC
VLQRLVAPAAHAQAVARDAVVIRSDSSPYVPTPQKVVDEMLRMVDALQFNEENGEVCPAGWQKGKAGMKANPNGVADYLAQHAKEL